MNGIKSPKKLIEVALPLDDINVAAAREKSIRHGHPSTLHLWWARRPLAAARAVLFAQMVNDPGGERGWSKGKTKAQADAEREKLFDIIRDLVQWENTNNEAVLERARAVVRESWRETCELNKGKPGFDPDKLPAFHDPFAGGGTIPLEAQRLGLESYASDLNPVAVMINKAMIEIPPKFAGRPPIGPIPESDKGNKKSATHDMHEDWSGAKGLAEDVRRYGHWMREEAFKRIGHLYPQVEITKDMAKDRPDLKKYVGKKLTVIAWLWARTVKSPNPAYSHIEVPLVRSFILSSKKGKETWIEPVIMKDGYHFKVRIGKQPADSIAGTMNRTGGICIMSSTSMPYKYIRDEGKAGRMNQRLMALVAEGINGRVYLSPESISMEDHSESISYWKSNIQIPVKHRNFQTPAYGMTTFGDLFTHRQIATLNIFIDLLQNIQNNIINDGARLNSTEEDARGLDEGGYGIKAYSQAIVTYLSFAIDKAANYWSSLCSWHSGRDTVTSTFGRQAIPMVWDYAEANPFSNSSGNFLIGVEQAKKVLEKCPARGLGIAIQSDAQLQKLSRNKVISTDPPYYDNICYADLSDYFYSWMRRSIKDIYPNLFNTISVPKAEELVATPNRHGSKENAEKFFMDGMIHAIHNLVEQSHFGFPVTIYYAFKQSETDEGSTTNTGWEAFLEAVIQAGFAIDGTWPMRTEYTGNLKKSMNALASSVVLVCRKREAKAVSISRRDFQRELREEMPEALKTMIGGSTGQSPIAPVDLAQAAIGPGMAIFSKYEFILNQDGTRMSVHDALVLINREITEYLNPESGSFDADTLFCDVWFDQYGWKNGPFGEADTLARAKGTSVEGVKAAGIIESGKSNVRLLKWNEYPEGWDPRSDQRTPVWEACHYLIKALNQKGEGAAGQLLARMPERGEAIRQLAYHLYTLCERKKWAEEARAYNELIASWHAIVAESHQTGRKDEQIGLDL